MLRSNCSDSAETRFGGLPGGGSSDYAFGARMIAVLFVGLRT